ncbi:hypothetical protein XELAEV_18033527mg [Xenopus laevis]|uniref:Uncharacterized protein n=1 Tax=Xenopus laevis TaxID=8355 RepID=A0A974CJN8_XENLA|nr:hypothetical protein XELAEV_18033527mg [Xenopus laevis]
MFKLSSISILVFCGPLSVIAKLSVYGFSGFCYTPPFFKTSCSVATNLFFVFSLKAFFNIFFGNLIIHCYDGNITRQLLNYTSKELIVVVDATTERRY